MGNNASSTEVEETESTTNDTTATDQGCKDVDAEMDEDFLAFLGLSVIITIGLSFIVRRKNCWPNCCRGRPGFMQPMNFMDEIGRRWAYAACFVIITYDIMRLFLGESHLGLMPKEDEEWMRKFGWVSVFNKLLEAMCVCLVFYPLLVCIDHRHSIAANVVGLLYLIAWIANYTYFFFVCRIEEGFIGIQRYIFWVPIYVALYVVGFSYVLDLILNCKRRHQHPRKATDETKSASDNTEKRDYKISHHFKYVFNLLRERSEKQTDETKSAIKMKSKKLIKRVKYEKILGFCYSTRIVCSITVSATFLFWIMMSDATANEYFFQTIISLCSLLDNYPEFQPIFAMFCEYAVITRILLHVANVLAGLVVLGFLFNTLISYKRRWHQLLRGDHSWHTYGSTINSPKSTLFNGLKFAGYQVAYVAWGWIVLTTVLSFLFGFLTFSLIIPLKDGVHNWLIKLLSKLWPTVLLGFIIAWVQKLICRFCFLQGKGTALALDNRRVYNAVSYYFLVLNVIIGVFSCLKRILIPLVLGVAFLSRLDRPLIMPGFETYDPGFASFVSMLFVDLYHNHPVVKTFVELLLQVREQREQQQQQEQQELLTGKGQDDAVQTAEKSRRSKRIRNRWVKAVTLVNNPTLAVQFLEQRLKAERKRAEQTTQSPANAEESSYAIEMQPLHDTKEATSSLQVLVL